MRVGGVFVAVLTIVSIHTAQADTINFTQWGPSATPLASPLTGVTADGNTFVISNGATSSDAFEPRTDGTSWSGTFASGTNILWSTAANSEVSIGFADVLSTITLAAESNDGGNYTETFYAYDGATLVDTQSASADADFIPGTVPYLTLTAADITAVVLDVTNNEGGFGFNISSLTEAPLATPLPTALPLFATGLGALGLVGWRRKRKAQVVAG